MRTWLGPGSTRGFRTSENFPGAVSTIALYVWFMSAPLVPDSALGRELPQVVVDVDLEKLSPLGPRHPPEQRVWSPIVGRFRIPSRVHNSNQLLFFDVEVEIRTVGNAETCWASQSHRLLGEPIDQ